MQIWVLIQTLRNAHSHLHGQKVFILTEVRWRPQDIEEDGGGVGERWLTAGIPLRIVLKCMYKCRSLQNHPTMQTPFFKFLLGRVSPSGVFTNTHTCPCKPRGGESPAISVLNSSDFLFSPLPCIPPCIVPASDGSRPYSWKQESQQEQKEGWGKALSKPPLSIVSLLSLLCFFFFFFLNLSLTSGLCPGGGKKL